VRAQYKAWLGYMREAAGWRSAPAAPIAPSSSNS
jgi:hypothetical protein